MYKKTISLIFFCTIVGCFITGCGKQSLENNVVYEVKEATSEKNLKSIDVSINSEEKEDIGDDKTSTIDEFSQAILENRIDDVKEMIVSDSVNINEKNSEEQYPIEVALVFSNSEIAKILLEAGADPYVETSDGTTVYDIVMNNHSNYMQYIFEEYSTFSPKS